MPDLIPIESVDASALFVEGGLNDLLEQIEAEATDFEPDLTTATGRKQIASQAYKVARCKPVIDEAGKSLVKEWKEQAKIVDSSRKHARDYLDALRAKIREPLTEWEAEQDRIKAAQELAEQIEQEHGIALHLNDLWDREVALKQQEAEAAERVRQEQAEIRARELVELERKQEQEEATRKLVLAEQAAERAKKNKAEAVRAERVRVEREQAERKRIADEQAEIKRREEEARKNDLMHQRDVNKGAYESLIKEGLKKDIARKVVVMVATGLIRGMKMVY